jgi:plastocyanin
MRKTTRGLLALGILVTSACGGSEGPNDEFTVEVTPTAAELFSVAPGNTIELDVVAKDGGGDPLSGGTTTYSTGNSAIATVSDAGVITAVAVGTTQVTATVTLDGGSASATTSVTVRDAAAAATVRAPGLVFIPGTVDVSEGGTVTWTIEDVHHTVNFETAGSPSDIGELLNASESRTFPASGTYRYRCSIHSQMTGIIRVH